MQCQIMNSMTKQEFHIVGSLGYLENPHCCYFVSSPGLPSYTGQSCPVSRETSPIQIPRGETALDALC